MTTSSKPDGLPTPGDIWLHPVHFLSLGFGSGLAPKAPGTFGTLAGIPIYLLMVQLPQSLYLGLLLAMSLLGIYLCGQTTRALGVEDHGGIVWDEIVGLLATLAFVEFSLLNLLAGFLLFRLFDIWKPWPIRLADRRLHGGLGIMLDDLIAAVYAALCLALLGSMLG